MESDSYVFRKVWDTPQLSKATDGFIDSPLYHINGFDYMLRIVMPEKAGSDNYIFGLIMYHAPQTAHEVTVNLKFLGKKPRVLTGKGNLSQSQPSLAIEDVVPSASVKAMTRKDKLSIDITITHKSSSAASALPDTRSTTGYVGLQNQAATCYMNSIIQLLFHLPAFRRLIYSIPEPADVSSSSITLSLQRLFALMQLSPTAPSTVDLTKSFGWNTYESFQQHDVQEFLRVLIGNLEEKLKPTQLNGQIAELFRGKTSNYIRCINIDFSSSRLEEFYDVNLLVRGKRNLQESFSAFVAEELMNGDNQYTLDDGRKSDAVMGCRFAELPPVLHIHLSRFEYSATSITGMEKVKDRLEYPFSLNLSAFLSEGVTCDANYELFSVLVHIGDSLGGHYIAYCRPTSENKWFKFNDSIVESATLEEVTEHNFGGQNVHNHAYYLCYLRKSDIKWLMEPIKDIPRHLSDYFEEVRIGFDRSIVSIKIENLADMQRIILKKAQKVSDLLSEIRKTHPEIKEVWSLDSNSMPLSKLGHSSLLQEFFPSAGRVFASPLDSSSIAFPSLFELKFFFPKSKVPIKNKGFFTFSQTSKVKSILPYVKLTFGFAEKVSLLVYHESGQSFKEVSIEKDFLSQDIQSGALIFQLSPESKDEVSSINDEDDHEENLFRLRDLLPEISLDTAPRFINHIKRCIHVKLSDKSNPEKTVLTIEIPDVISIKALIKCARKALSVGDNDGIALYLPDTEGLINNKQASDLRTALSIKGQFIQMMDVCILMRIVKGRSQSDVDSSIPLVIPFYDENANFKKQVYVEALENDMISTVLSDVRKQAELDAATPLRMLKISSSRIIAVLKENERVSSIKEYEIRVEKVPEDQISVNGGDFLIRVAFSHNYFYPPNGCVLTPFLFRVIEGEEFEITATRLYSLIETNMGDLQYILFTGAPSGSRFVLIPPDAVLSDFARSPDAILFVIVKTEEILKILYGIGGNQAVTIRN